jgi:predicted nucleic acid-binding protein
MSKSLLLDANVIINICNQAPNSQALQQIIEQYNHIYISDFSFFVAELNLVQKERSEKDKRQFAKQLDIFYDIGGVAFNEAIFKQARKVVKSRDYEDACQVATALKHKCDILTSDQDLNKLYSSIINIIFVPKK